MLMVAIDCLDYLKTAFFDWGFYSFSSYIRFYVFQGKKGNNIYSIDKYRVSLLFFLRYLLRFSKTSQTAQRYVHIYASLYALGHNSHNSVRFLKKVEIIIKREVQFDSEDLSTFQTSALPDSGNQANTLSHYSIKRKYIATHTLFLRRSSDSKEIELSIHCLLW